MHFEVRYEAWQLKNKLWIKERKEQWKYLEKKVKQTDVFNRKQRGYLKDYFIKGVRPEYDYIDNPMPIPLLFMLWFHPDQSQACWNEIVSYVWKMPDDIIYDHYKTSIEIFTRNAGTVFRYNPKDGFYDGFMGGLEERIFSLLFGEKYKNYIYISPEWEVNLNDLCVIPASWFYSIIWLKKSLKNTNPTVFWQYDQAIELCFEGLKNSDIERFLDLDGADFPDRKENARKDFYEYLNILAGENYPEGEFRVNYIKKMRTKLNEEKIPPLLDELWQKAKKGELTPDYICSADR